MKKRRSSHGPETADLIKPGDQDEMSDFAVYSLFCIFFKRTGRDPVGVAGSYHYHCIKVCESDCEMRMGLQAGLSEEGKNLFREDANPHRTEERRGTV